MLDKKVMRFREIGASTDAALMFGFNELTDRCAYRVWWYASKPDLIGFDDGGRVHMYELSADIQTVAELETYATKLVTDSCDETDLEYTDKDDVYVNGSSVVITNHALEETNWAVVTYDMFDGLLYACEDWDTGLILAQYGKVEGGLGEVAELAHSWSEMMGSLCNSETDSVKELGSAAKEMLDAVHT